MRKSQFYLDNTYDIPPIATATEQSELFAVQCDQ